jgi:hypothetical protein
MHPLTKEIVECNGQEALQKAMAMEDKDDLWNGCIQAMAIIATTTKEPPVELIVLWDLLLNEMDQRMDQETTKEEMGLFVSKLVLFYQRVQQYSIKVPEPLAHFATLKSKVTSLLSLRITMTEGGYTRFYPILSRNDGETVEKTCGLISYLFGNKRYVECRMLLEYMTRRKSTIGTYSSLDEFLWEACKCYFKQDSRILTRERIYRWIENYKGGKYRTEAIGILWMNAFGLPNVRKEITSLWTNEEDYILSQVQELLMNLKEVPKMDNVETEDMDVWEFIHKFVPKALPKYENPNPEPKEVKMIRVKDKR